MFCCAQGYIWYYASANVEHCAGLIQQYHQPAEAGYLAKSVHEQIHTVNPLFEGQATCHFCPLGHPAYIRDSASIRYQACVRRFTVNAFLLFVTNITLSLRTGYRTVKTVP